MSEIRTKDWDLLDGEERIRRWPSKIKEKRPLHVDISTWLGTSPGAKHYYVRIHEEDNAWWCEKENAWVTVSCDSEKRGFSLNAEVLTKEEAIACARFFIRLVAGPRRRRHCLRCSLTSGITERDLTSEDK